MRTRVVPTSSGRFALQVVSKRDGVVTVHKHIGSFSTPKEKQVLLEQAQMWIQETTHQQPLFTTVPPQVSDIIITDSKPLFLYRLLDSVYTTLGFSAYPDPLIKDLIISRIYRPSSKLEALTLLSSRFNRVYAPRTLYRRLKQTNVDTFKTIVQQALIGYVKKELQDTLQLVFYDVTTLYFDSQVKTELKRFGFSKDHRPSDTQIVLGLVVNRDGFPLYIDIFNGNTFEGHTFIPVVKTIQKLLHTDHLVIVADSAMISRDNIAALQKEHIGFIVGARLGNLPGALIDTIVRETNKKDMTIATVTYQECRLICQYSDKRAAKDRSDRTKQIDKAKQALETPGSVISRYRFLKKSETQQYILNQALVTKAERLEGIKGYITNTELPGSLVIERYHDLWHIENSFRLTKSDLEARPIFHHIDAMVKLHVLLVFAGLAMCKYMEIQTHMSMKKLLSLAEQMLTHTVINTVTQETQQIETTIADPLVKQKIDLLRSLGH